MADPASIKSMPVLFFICAICGPGGCDTAACAAARESPSRPCSTPTENHTVGSRGNSNELSFLLRGGSPKRGLEPVRLSRTFVSGHSSHSAAGNAHLFFVSPKQLKPRNVLCAITSSPTKQWRDDTMTGWPSSTTTDELSICTDALCECSSSF